MDEKILFKRTLDDIRAKMKGDRYELLRACGLLRHLLLDQTPLYVIVNRPHSLKITFKVTLCPFVVPNTGYMFQSPMPFIFGFEEVKIDQFLAFKVFLYEGYPFTVIDVIQGASNLMGGIHSGQPKNDAEKKLKKLFNDNHMPDTVFTGICHVALDAMKPLESLL